MNIFGRFTGFFRLIFHQEFRGIEVRIPGRSDRKTKSLSKMASEQIKDAILSGIFQPGDKLVETTLTESMGVSRTPLREAFRELAAEGYITVVPHKGAHVSIVSEDEVLDIYAITSVLEGLATRLASPNLREGRANEKLHEFYEQLKRHHECGEVMRTGRRPRFSSPHHERL